VSARGGVSAQDRGRAGARDRLADQLLAGRARGGDAERDPNWRRTAQTY